jgi:hypothetical protein
MATTANYFDDDFSSYLESNDPSAEQSNSTLHLYPDLEDGAAINPSSLSYNEYPNALGSAFSIPPSAITTPSSNPSIDRASIYDHALDAVLHAASSAQFIASNSSLAPLPYTTDNIRSFASESTATPTFEQDSPQQSLRRQSVSSAKSRRKSSVKSVSSKRPRRKSKAMVSSPDLDDSEDDGEEYSGEDMTKSKRERALERNRLAASKCREKKKAYHHDLEERARQLGEERKGLINNVRALQDQLFAIKGHFLEHVDCQCTEIRDYIKSTVRPITAEGLAMYQAFDEYVVSQMNGSATPAMGVAQLQSTFANLGKDGLPRDVVATIGSMGLRSNQQHFQNDRLG